MREAIGLRLQLAVGEGARGPLFSFPAEGDALALRSGRPFVEGVVRVVVETIHKPARPDARLGLGQAGRMSRYLQETPAGGYPAWLLVLPPGKVGQQTLVRFGWPAVSASEVRA